FFLQFFPRAEQERLKREYHSIRRGVVIGTSRSLSRVVTGVTVRITTVTDLVPRGSCWHRGGAGEELSVGSSQVYPKSSHVQKSGDRHQPTSQQSSNRSHGHNNDRHGSDRRGGSDNHRSSNNNYSGSNNRNSGNGRDQRNRGHLSNRSANSGSQQSRDPSEGYSYPVCTTCG
nr:hypothetical protein [Tanacetum cinerariifolium]